MNIEKIEYGLFYMVLDHMVENDGLQFSYIYGPNKTLFVPPERDLEDRKLYVTRTSWEAFEWEYNSSSSFEQNPNASPKPSWDDLLGVHRIVTLDDFARRPPIVQVNARVRRIRERPVTNDAGMVINTEGGMNHLTALLDVSYEGYGNSATHWPIPVLSNRDKTDTHTLWTQRGAREFLNKVQRQILEAKSAEAILRKRIEAQLVIVRDEFGGLGSGTGEAEQDLSMPAVQGNAPNRVQWDGSLGQIDAEFVDGNGDAYLRRLRLVSGNNPPSQFETGEVGSGSSSQHPMFIDDWENREEAIELTATHGSVRLPGPGLWENVSAGDPYQGRLPSDARTRLSNWIDSLSGSDRTTAGAITLTLLRPRTTEEAAEARLVARETARDEAQRLIDESLTEMDAIIAGFDSDEISDDINDARVQYSEKISHVARQRRDFIVDAPNLRDQGHFSCDEQLDAIREIEKLRQLAIRKFAASVSADQAALESAYDQAAADINAVTVVNAPTWSNRTGGADAALVPSATPPEITLPSTGGTVVIDAINPAVDELQSDQLAITSVTGDPELATATAFSYPTASLGRQRVSIPITSTTTIKLVARNACGPSELTVRVVVGTSKLQFS